jgi:peptide/nickel transport system permease protein
MAILVFSVRLAWFPASSTHSVGAADLGRAAYIRDALWHAALPAGVLGLGSAAVIARYVRAGLLDNLGEGFVRAARARGGSRRRVVLAHALRASASPIVTLAGVQLPLLVSGALVIEVVFGWPGMGRVTYEAILAHDVAVALAAVLLATVVVVAGNLAADVAVAALDPRVRRP